MATRKQRKRTQKERRHEYETVWVDGEGNDLEEPPDDAREPSRDTRQNGKKPQQKRQQQQSSRATRAPLPPSWRRAARRAFLVAAMLTVFLYISNSKASGGARTLNALGIGALYGLAFTPLMYYLDKFAYSRWLKKTSGPPAKR